MLYTSPLSAFKLCHTANSQDRLYSLLFLNAFLLQSLFSYHFLHLDVTTCPEFNPHFKVLLKKLVPPWNLTFSPTMIYCTILYHVLISQPFFYNSPSLFPADILLIFSVCLLPYLPPTRLLSSLAWKVHHIYLCTFIILCAMSHNINICWMTNWVLFSQKV